MRAPIGVPGGVVFREWWLSGPPLLSQRYGHRSGRINAVHTGGVLQYKWEVYCKVFRLQGSEAKKIQRHKLEDKLEVYGSTSLRQVLRFSLFFLALSCANIPLFSVLGGVVSFSFWFPLRFFSGSRLRVQFGLVGHKTDLFLGRRRPNAAVFVGLFCSFCRFSCRIFWQLWPPKITWVKNTTTDPM